jgi:hypothetical protein
MVDLGNLLALIVAGAIIIIFPMKIALMIFGGCIIIPLLILFLVKIFYF